MAYRGTSFFQQHELESVRRMRESGALGQAQKSCPNCGAPLNEMGQCAECDMGGGVISGQEASEVLNNKQKYQGMLKVAQKHEDAGRPNTAAKIRKKAQRFGEAHAAKEQW